MSDKTPTQGILYIVTGDDYVIEFEKNVPQVAKHLPGFPIAVVSDRDIDSPYISQTIRLEDPAYSLDDKVRGLTMSPFDHTLFLDTDVVVVDDISDLFDNLRRLDMSVVMAPHRRRKPPEGVPASFPELNIGVLAYRNHAAFQAFAVRWTELYVADKAAGVKLSQPAFRRALFESDLRFSVLPPEYHLFVGAAGLLQGPVKVIHGHDLDTGVAEFFNQSTSLRTYFMVAKKRRPQFNMRTYTQIDRVYYLWERSSTVRLTTHIADFVARIRARLGMGT